MGDRSRFRRNDRQNSSSWNDVKNTRTHIPTGLRGKAIGLYFRDRQVRKSKKDLKLELVISFHIPPAIENRVLAKLQSIQKIADALNIPIYKRDISTLKPVCLNNEIEEPIKVTSVKNETLTLEEDGIEFVPDTSSRACAMKGEEKAKILESDLFFVDTDPFKAPDFIPLYNPKPGTSTSALSGPSAPEFVPIKKILPTDKNTTRLFSLRSGGDYKYSYEDIITGTFDEKLDECLSNGISINFSNPDIQKLNVDYFEEYKKMLTKPAYKKMMAFRENLPAYKRANEILDVVNQNQVIVISGETGCGKSTQVPQIILDDALKSLSGANTKILVTQPRRIAASSLAARVASERGERMGNSVGYAVRLEKIDARQRGSILFCTTGILLNDLEMKQGLTDYTHVILDEVHERDCNIDLSMCMLKKVLNKRKDLKLILMSATIEAHKLSQYFDNCPMLHIEGLAFPVKDYYLEDVLQMTKFQLEEPKNNRNIPPKRMKHTKWGRQMGQRMEQDIQYKHEIAPWLESVKYKLDPSVYKTLQDSRIEDLNIDLILDLLTFISCGPPGAILVFLPGIGEISKLIRLMDESRQFPPNSFEIYPLHSKLPSLEQHKIFERPPPNKRKIIVATNIAETSITIDDIVYVVDCGRVKISGLSVDDNVSTLKTEWIAQANLRQRRGRAGRCQNGVCYHLLTSYRASKILDHMLPELQRSNLLEPVLTIKRLRLGKAAEALKLVPSPPSDTTVKWAVKHLQQCGGLDDNEVLTPLGWHLARLPVHPSAGKLLVLGALFGCLDRAASVAAVWGFKDPFQLVIGKEKEVDAKKRMFALGEPSDHVAISEAIIQWERCPPNRRHSFAYENFLSNNTVQLLSEMKGQLGDSLRNMGFLASGDVRSAWENRNANNFSLFKAIVAASLYPNIATVRWTNLNANPTKNKQLRIKVHTPEDSHNISVHPSSVMSVPAFQKTERSAPKIKLCDKPGQNWLVYWLKQRSTDLFLLEVTLVYTLPLLFFGELNVSVNDEENTDECYMSISTIKVKCKKETADLLFQLRTLLDHVLAHKVMANSEHSTRHNDFQECVLKLRTLAKQTNIKESDSENPVQAPSTSNEHLTHAVIELITAEDEQAEYLEDEFDSEQSEQD